MKNFILLLILQFCGYALFGQVSHWESYFKPTRAQNVLEEETTLWLPTDAGLLEVDKETGDYTLWNKLNGGLSSNTIEAVARHPQTRELFIGTYDVALMVREEPDGPWAPLPYPESWAAPFGQPLQTYCLEFDAQGILWAGTSWGLARYDGESWELYNQEDGHELLSWVKAIEPAPDGGIYAASHVAFHVRDGVFTPLSSADFQSEDFIFSYGDAAMCLQSDGNLWFFTDVGTAGRYQDGQWQVFHQIDSLNFFPSPPRFLTESPEGNLVACFGPDIWYQYAEGGWSAYPGASGLGQPLYFSFLEDGNVSMDAEQVMLQTAGGTQTISFPEYPFSTQLYYLNHDQQGQLWAKDGTVLRNLDAGTVITMEGEDAPAYFADYAFTSQGSLWATRHGAVFQQVGQGWKRYDHANSILPDATNSWQIAIGEDNTVWLSIYNHGLYSFRDGAWQRHLNPVFSAANISEMIPYPAGGLWLRLWGWSNQSRVGYWDGAQVNLLSDGEQGFRAGGAGQRLSYDPGSGLLWALDWQGLQVFNGQGWEQVLFPFEQETDEYEWIYTFSVRNGRLLAASNLRVFLFDGGEWFSYSSETAPLASEDIREAGLGQSGKLWVLHQSTPFVEVGQLSLASGLDDPEDVEITPIAVFPNPAEEVVFLDGVPGTGRGAIHFFDSQGRMAGRAQVYFAEGAPAEVPVAGLAPGWYVGRVYFNGKQYAFRLLKND